MSALKLQDDSGDPVLPRDGTFAKLMRKAGVAEVPLGRAADSITRREWFITHAPDVPGWFRYEAGKPPPKPAELVPEEELDAAQQAELAAWTAGEAIDFDLLSQPVRYFMVRWQRVHNMRREFEEWHIKRRAEKWWAWREHFADLMMEREGGK